MMKLKQKQTEIEAKKTNKRKHLNSIFMILK